MTSYQQNLGRGIRMKIEKVPHSTYLRWRTTFYKNRGNLRLGQAFINTFFPSVGEPTSTLFYQPDDKICDETILRDYIDMKK